jgi:MFS family permease
MGSSVASLGLIEGVAEGLASLLKTHSGAWSDQISRRKPFVLFGYLTSALAKPFIGLSHTWLHVLAARSLDRFGKGIRTGPRDAMISESTTQQQRGEAFGWHRGMDTLGAALGPLFTLTMIQDDPQSFRSLYFWALIPGLLSVLCVFFLKESGSQASVSSPGVKLKFTLLPWKHINGGLGIYFLSWGLFALCNSSDVFLLLKSKSIGMSTKEMVVVYCSYNLVYACMSPILGKLSDSISRKSILVAGFLVYTAVYLGFSGATSTLQIWALFIIYGLYMAATDGVGKALAIDLSQKNQKAFTLGTLGTITGIATVIASTTAGFLWDYFGPASTFYFGALGGLMAVTGLIFLKQDRAANH